MRRGKLKAKEIIKEAVKSSSFSQDQIEQVLGFCNARVPGYSDHFWRLYEEARGMDDKECVNLSVEGEIHYLISQSARICFVIEYIQKAMGHMGRVIRVLDIGATQFTRFYRDLLDIHVTALDRTGFLRARFERQGIDFIDCDFMKGEDIAAETDAFDLCIFTEVFEHMVLPPKQVFLPIRRVTRDGGMLIFSTPNIAKIQNRIRLVRGQGILAPIAWVLRDDFEDESPHGLGHIREYSIHELCELASRYGYSTLDIAFPIESAFILNHSLPDHIYRWLYGMFPSMGGHCQILARLDKPGQQTTN